MDSLECTDALTVLGSMMDSPHGGYIKVQQFFTATCFGMTIISIYLMRKFMPSRIPGERDSVVARDLEQQAVCYELS